MEKSNNGDQTAPSRLSHLRRFAYLFGGVFAAILAMAMLEGLWLWSRGARYQPKSSISYVVAGDVSLDATGRWAAARVDFRRHSEEEGFWSDVVIVDFQNGEAVPLGVRQLIPRCVALHPSANCVVIGCFDGSIYSVSGPFKPSIRRDRFRRRFFVDSGDTGLFRMVFSPDGRRLAARGPQFIGVWEWPGGKLLGQWPHNHDRTGVLCFSTDSSRLIFREGYQSLRMMDIESGELVETLAIRETDCLDPALVAFDPGGRRVAIVSMTDAGLYGIVVRHHADRIPVYNRVEEAYPIGIAFGPNGRLTWWDDDGNIHVWNVDHSREPTSFSLLKWASRNLE